MSTQKENSEKQENFAAVPSPASRKMLKESAPPLSSTRGYAFDGMPPSASARSKSTPPAKTTPPSNKK